MDGICKITPTEEELDIFNSLDSTYKAYYEGGKQDRLFLNSMILRKRPKKVLELGVAKGGSSVVLLNALKDIEGAHLYSHDYSEECYRVPAKKSGFIVDKYPDLKNKWTLYTGGFISNYIDKIGADIDLCFIDTVHNCPGEILDFLMVLPYLKKGATVIFHDIALHTWIENSDVVRHAYTTGLLQSVICGKKVLPSDIPEKSEYPFKNIGAIELSEDINDHVWEIFNLLTIEWQYFPSEEDLINFSNFVNQHYGKDYFEYFKQIIKNQREINALKTEAEQKLLEEKQKARMEQEQYINELNLKISQLSKIANRKTFVQKIFSITNTNDSICKHKEIYILGFKFSFKVK